MKTLIIYFSRTGVTKKVAEILKEKLGADIETIDCRANYKGIIGYLRAGREGMKRLTPEINPLKSQPADYDLVIVGTPVWGFTMSSPVRSFLGKYKSRIKRAAFFRTQGGTGAEKIFKEMAEILGQEPAAELVLLTKEVISGQAGEKIEKFINVCYSLTNR